MSLQMKMIISNNLNNNIMKRIFIALALLAGFQFADAQVKSPADAKKAVEAAEAAGIRGYLFKGGNLLEFVENILEYN